MSKQKNRDKITDIAKGVGIFLVVCLHSGLAFLTGVDMPLFFLISVFFAPSLAKHSSLGRGKEKTLTLLFPPLKYLIFFSESFPTSLRHYQKAVYHTIPSGISLHPNN